VWGLWKHRWLLREFLGREIKNRYLGSVSGVLWVLFQPLAQLAVYAFVFTLIFKVRFPELEGHGYIAFVAVALWPWLAFQEGVQRATVAIQNNAALIKKVAFPNELLVYASVAATYIIHAVGLLLVLLVLKLAGVAIHLSALPEFALLLLVMMACALGLGLICAAFQVFLRDLEQILAPLFMLWFYASPILYPASLVPPTFRVIIEANPISYFAGRARSLLLYGDWEFGITDGAVVIGVCLLCWAGLSVFRRCATRFEDFL
jgi:ABC-type polysaccharide/polyol phosphate export permease